MSGSQPLYLDRKTITIDTCDLGFIQFPEFFLRKRLKQNQKTGVLGGDWDRSLDREMMFSSKYEAANRNEAGMVPIENYGLINAMKERFIEGAEWKDTAWYSWVSENRPKRYETHNKVIERLQLIEDLFDAAQNQSLTRKEDDVPLINIGRDGKLSIDDGRHRLCVAILAKLKEFPVAVSFIHPDAANTKYGKLVLTEAPKPLPFLQKALKLRYGR